MNRGPLSLQYGLICVMYFAIWQSSPSLALIWLSVPALSRFLTAVLLKSCLILGTARFTLTLSSPLALYGA
jgi:hypothetical protein